MAIKCTNWREVELEFMRMKEEYDHAAVQYMAKYCEEKARHAKETGDYQDQTANLRNSIGYVVMQYGKIVSEQFTGNDRGIKPGGDPQAAHSNTRKYIEELARDFGTGKTYGIVATGMSYDVYVEAHGKAVLTQTIDHAEANKERDRAEFAEYLKSRLG
mgnify:CR=1 FL=1